MNLAVLQTASAFWKTKRLASRLRTREDVLRWQQQQLSRFLRETIRRVPHYANGTTAQLRDLPIIDKATVLANFDRLNVLGVTLDQARLALDRREERVRGLIVGQSTGTSGNRGVYVISEAERFTWLGVMLAKTLPDFPWVAHKVALVLPSFGSLYQAAMKTGRLTLRFFDLELGLERWRDELRAYGADTIVAPPKILRALAEGGGVHPRNIFSGAEVLDPIDRQIIEGAFGATVREIYMATEGLFGVSCARGTLHLAEDFVAFEWERPSDSSELVTPIITDFTRSTQIMARYRMNDLLRLSSMPCPCGSPLQAVSAVEGRRDDVFLIPGKAEEGLVMITPDVLRNAIVDADRRILDFRVVQVGPDRIELSLAQGVPLEATTAAVANLRGALSRAGVENIDIRLKSGIGIPYDKKLRRVRRDWQPPERDRPDKTASRKPVTGRAPS